MTEKPRGTTRDILHFEGTQQNVSGPAPITSSRYSRFQRQISMLFMMMSYLCEADISAVAGMKSKCCAEILVVLEVKGVMFFLIPGAERLCGAWQVPSS